LFAKGLGIPGDFVTPLPLVLLMVPAVILAGIAVASWPARTAARVGPARVLRAEMRGRGNTDTLAETYGLLAVASRGG
jgi:hypothetical protein